jgi:hypothetical protein
MRKDLAHQWVEGVRSAAYVGLTRIVEQEAHHLAFSHADQDWPLWIAADPKAPVPLMLQVTDPNVQDSPTLTVHLLDWNEAPEIDPAEFSFAPAEGDEKVAFPQLDGPAEGGAPAQAERDAAARHANPRKASDLLARRGGRHRAVARACHAARSGSRAGRGARGRRHARWAAAWRKARRRRSARPDGPGRPAPEHRR